MLQTFAAWRSLQPGTYVARSLRPSRVRKVRAERVTRRDGCALGLASAAKKFDFREIVDTLVNLATKAHDTRPVV